MLHTATRNFSGKISFPGKARAGLRARAPHLDCSTAAFGKMRMAKLDGLIEELVTANRDLARGMGSRATALMRGHGATVVGKSVRHAVYVSVYLEVNARLQKQGMDMGTVKFLTTGEIDKVAERTGPYGINRAWENWCRRAGRPYRPEV